MRWITPLVASSFSLATIAVALPEGGPAGESTAATGAQAARTIPAEAVKKAVVDHVEARTREGEGTYRLKDELTGHVLELTFERTGVVAAEGVWAVHDDASHAPGGKDYFACTMFRPAHGPDDRRYDLDFRVVAEAGSYVVREVVIHRHGKRVDGRWEWTRRKPRPQDVGTNSGR